MASKQQIKKSYRVQVDAQACKACGYCREVCPRSVFAQEEFFNDRGYRPAKVNDTTRCIGCQRCFFICPDFAIEVESLGQKETTHEETI